MGFGSISGASGVDVAAYRRMTGRALGPELTVAARLISAGHYVVDPVVNGYPLQGHTNAAGTAAIDSDLAVLVANIGGGTTAFAAIQYPSVTKYPNGDLSTGSVALAATGTTVTLRTEYTRLSRRVVRKRIYKSATVATSILINDGYIGETTACGLIGWNDQIPLESRHMNGLAFHLASANWTLGTAFGMGVCDAWQARRHLSDAADTWWPSTLAGFRLTVGNNGGVPALPVGTTEDYVDLFYWAAQWNASDLQSQRRELAMCYADANEIPEQMDEIVRMSAAAAIACKSSTAPGGATPVCHDSPSSVTGFPRGDAFAQFGLRDHAFNAGLVARWATALATGQANTTLNGTVVDQITDAGVSAYRWADNTSLLLIWAAWLTGRTLNDTDSAGTNGLTDTQRNNMVSALTAKDDGTGQLLFTAATDGRNIGHYDWYVVPNAITHFKTSHMDGYYAAGLLAASQLGYGATNNARIANAIAQYQGAFDSSLGHLRFLKDTDAGTWLTYGSLLDLLPEWWAVFVLGQPAGLLGKTITSACVSYFLGAHMAPLAGGGRALRLMMQHGGSAYISPAEMSSIAPGTYVNGGSQLLFDFIVASLGQYYGVPGCRSFWADRKRAEVNVDFDVHEAICLVNPSPAPDTDPYNSRNTGRNLPWNGLIAAFEKHSGLVD